MKGQLIAVCSALRSIAQFDALPVNIKFLVEGEEEIGSPHLRKFIQDHKDLLSCTFCLNPDAGMISPEIPAIVYSLRGLVFFELKITGPERDLHSGVFGGIVHNPAVALAEVVSKLHDADGKITIPGYYEHVRQLSSDERRELARLPMQDSTYLAQTGAPLLWGEKEYTPTERIGARPTLEINGMISGFTGNGTKTVLPAYAVAKISSRIVADQTPDDLHRKLRAYLEKIVPPTVRWELTYLGGSLPSATNPHSPYTAALDKALEAVWGNHPVYKREGGSVPVVGDIQKILGADSVLTGFGLPDDCIHSPNERLHLPTWRRGIQALIHFFYNLQG
jgi:acetylornithine deacetylase/succinyl-diaminopimelate desuccinylase-like protein